MEGNKKSSLAECKWEDMQFLMCWWTVRPMCCKPLLRKKHRSVWFLMILQVMVVCGWLAEAMNTQEASLGHLFCMNSLISFQVCHVFEGTLSCATCERLLWLVYDLKNSEFWELIESLWQMGQTNGLSFLCVLWWAERLPGYWWFCVVSPGDPHIGLEHSSKLYGWVSLRILSWWSSHVDFFSS